MTPWATREQAREYWDDAADIPDATLDKLLSVATTQGAGYARPADQPADGAPIPEHLMLGTVYQARELWAAAQRDGDVIGAGDFALRARPLIGTVRALWRPKRIGFDVA